MNTPRLTIFINEINSFYYIPRKRFNWSIETVAWQFNKWQIRFCFWKDFSEYASKQHRKTPIGLLWPPCHIYFILLSKIITQFVPVEIKMIVIFFSEKIVKEKRQLLITLNNEIFFFASTIETLHFISIKIKTNLLLINTSTCTFYIYIQVTRSKERRKSMSRCVCTSVTLFISGFHVTPGFKIHNEKTDFLQYLIALFVSAALLWIDTWLKLSLWIE